MSHLKQWFVSTTVNNMMVKNCVLLLFQFSACWAVISGCTMDKHDTLVCKSITELYQVNAYKELKKIEINREDESGQWSIIKNDAFKGMKNLDVIFIRGNVSHFEPHALRGIDHPFKFVLLNNNLEELPEELFNGVPVFLVGLATTRLKELKPKLFKNTPLLKEFHVHEAKLTVAKAGVFSNTDIAIVELSSNEITTIEDGAFTGMKKLYQLDLSDNKLTTFDVDKVLGSSSTIELLYLGENLLTTLSTFPTLPKMRAMGFEKNAIATIESKCFANLKNLEILELSFNKLKSIPAATLPGRLQRLGVGENPWTCSYLTGLKAWAKKSNVELFCGDSYEPCTISCI